ncbi:hypothetical protein [Algoriphagus litoralis]|uniref:hypothetical protein n=1 Tax=Algoriphagus litoralis TaxID=2202829 RepID=UPI000DB9AB64|nr:hypothetical protein [Algoriphagus litoralis]
MLLKYRINSSFALLCLLIGALSCNPAEEKLSGNAAEDFSLVKVDSFQVENFTRVVIRDYSPVERRFLGYSVSQDDLLEISEQGEILSRVNKKGDGPESYGTWNPVGMAFGPDSLRILEFPFNVIAYDPNYTKKYEYRYLSPLPIRANMPLGRPAYYSKGDSTFLLIGPSNYLSANYLTRTKEGKDTLQNFYQMHLESGSVASIIPYEANSIYSSTDLIYFERMGKTFFLDQADNELYVLHDIEAKIRVYGLEDLALKREIPITHSEFKEYSPLPMDTEFSDPRIGLLRNNSGKNLNLIPLDDEILLVRYFTGLTEAEFESRNSEEEPYAPLSDASEQRFLILKGGTQLVGELPGIPGSIVLSLPGNRILVQEPENQEEEEELTRFSIYELKVKTE